jgi:hypothetical protein
MFLISCFWISGFLISAAEGFSEISLKWAKLKYFVCYSVHWVEDILGRFCHISSLLLLSTFQLLKRYVQHFSLLKSFKFSHVGCLMKSFLNTFGTARILMEDTGEDFVHLWRNISVAKLQIQRTEWPKVSHIPNIQK